MSNTSTGEYPGKSAISLLPIIDINPTDMTCIYSTLKFVQSQAKELNIVTPVIRFDQPLYIKAMEIVKANNMNMVVMLGGFHLLMSFLGSFGEVMKGSGLEDALEELYGKSTVPHLISGKAVSRALRGHFLVELALVCQLMVPLISMENDLEEDDIENETCNNTTPGTTVVRIDDLLIEIENMTDAIKENKVVEMHEDSSLLKLRISLEEYKTLLGDSSRTAKLWLQYLYYIDIVRLFVRAERVGDWDLYLISVKKMINLFAATGHINYAKCARLHLQNMLDLKNTHPWVYERFRGGGLHTSRRSDKYWVGIWADLTIDQVMMRAIKTNGGVTRGRGVSETTRQLWLGSIHRCADIHNAMTELTGASRKTSEQHVQLTSSRITRDNKDLETMKEWFDLHIPFNQHEPNLKSLSSGLIADSKINCDDAEPVGETIQSKRDNMIMEDISIKRKDKVKKFESLLPTTKIGDNNVHINPLILFTRLTALMNSEDNIAVNFRYEHTPEPIALFKDGIMRKPGKFVLRNHLLSTAESMTPQDHDVCVIDGGTLLHKVFWPKSTFGDVLDQYVQYVKTKYGKCKCVNVVFDGYSDKNSTRAQEHHRRTTLTSTSLEINGNTKVTFNREALLANTNNKDQLIKLLCARLKEAGFSPMQCEGDPDISIVKTGIEYAKVGRNVAVVTEDTDVLVLLMYHRKEGMGQLMFGFEKREKKERSKWIYWDIHDLVATQSNPETLLFAHAWTGCDTTSAIYQKGK